MTRHIIRSLSKSFLSVITIGTAAGILACGMLFINTIQGDIYAAERPRLSEFEELIKKYNVAPVPQRIQVGGTCGLYALGMVMDYWHSKNPSNPTFLVQDIDLQRPGTRFQFEPTSPERIFNFVYASGFTHSGEMFDASKLAQTAIHFGYQAGFYPQVSQNEIYSALDRKHPVIIAFDVHRNGKPALMKGKHAHYGILEGYFDYQGTRFVIAKHGWRALSNNGEDYVWKAEDLFNSMNNLEYTEYYPFGDVPRGIRLPIYKRNPRLRDISKSLKNTMIEVVPYEEPLAGGVIPSF